MSKKIYSLLTACMLVAALNDSTAAQQTTCSSCSDCSQKLNGSYSNVTLTQNISASVGDCITISAAGVTFDCNAYDLTGAQQGIGIYNSGYDDVEIKNCNVSHFGAGIYLRNIQQSNSITGSTAAYNEDYGILLERVDNSLLSNNTALYNSSGISLRESSGNQLISNESCANIEADIQLIDSGGNTGDQNRCDDVSQWSDAGSQGCTYGCETCDDQDQDQVCDADDNCLTVPNGPGGGTCTKGSAGIPCASDSNCGTGNACSLNQEDTDQDGVGDACDNCPDVTNGGALQVDTDIDGIGDACDNCLTVKNSSQADTDGDCNVIKTPYPFGQDPHCGDACDNCPYLVNPKQANSDTDSYGDVCDNCIYDYNENQQDTDKDGVGDICDNCLKTPNGPAGGTCTGTYAGAPCKANNECTLSGTDTAHCSMNQEDQDGDSYGNVCDNCQVYNPNQLDPDGDGLGKECDNCPPVSNKYQQDTDNDGVGDDCDCDDGIESPSEDGIDCGGYCYPCASENCSQYDPLPTSFSWRNYQSKNWMTFVKDQGDCNSCWAFAAVGAMEATYNIQQNKLINLDLSEQNLVSDCSQVDAGGCESGGDPFKANTIIKDDGIVDESCFSYEEEDLSCGDRCQDWQDRLWKIVDFKFANLGTPIPPLRSQAIDKIKRAITCYGPLAACSGAWWHCIVIVGWDQNDWIIKNSWGTGWGDNGYGKISFNTHKYSDILAWPIFDRLIYKDIQ